MINILLILHVIVSCLLIIFILLNKGKGSETGMLTINTDVLNFKDSNSLLKKIIIFLSILTLISTISINTLNQKIKNKTADAIVKIIEK